MKTNQIICLQHQIYSLSQIGFYKSMLLTVKNERNSAFEKIHYTFPNRDHHTEI